MAFSVDNHFSPKQIAEAEFPSAFRGYDQEAVRIYLQDVADTMAQVQDRQDKNGVELKDPEQGKVLRELKRENSKLRSRLSSLETKSKSSNYQDLQDDQVAEVLGKEATRILETARAAASQIVDRAHEEAQDVHEVAEKDATRIKDQATKILAVKKSEAERLSESVISKAEKQATKVRAGARSDYDRAKLEVSKILNEAKEVLFEQEGLAKQRAEKIVRQAEEYRERLVTELLEQRRTGAKDLDELLATRDILAKSLDSAKSTLDSLNIDLHSVMDIEKSRTKDISFEKELQRTLKDLDDAVPFKDEAIEMVDFGDELEDLSALSSQKDFDDIDYENLVDLEEESDFSRSNVDAEFIDLDQVNLRNEKVSKREQKVSAGVTRSSELNGVSESRSKDWSSDQSNDIEVKFLDEDPTDLFKDSSQIEEVDEDIYVADLHFLDDENSEEDWEEVLTSVAGRSYGTVPDESRGDLPSLESYHGRIPQLFKDRDVALSRSGSDLRRAVKRALNDDQSDILDRLSAGTGPLRVDELPTLEDQIDHYFDPLKSSLGKVIQAGAKTAGGIIPESLINSVTIQLAKHIVIRVRIPTVEIVEHAVGSDREVVLDPIRDIYRDFRNNFLLGLLEDSLFETFALGHYIVLPDGVDVEWALDPRLEPDPLCEINARTTGLKVGEIFPSGHNRPLSLPGCRCILTSSEA